MTDEEFRRIEARWKSDMDLKVDQINRRTLRLEIMIATAMGAIVILGWIGARTITTIERQADKIEAVAIRQSAAIAERQSAESYGKERDARMQVQIDQIRDRK